MSTRPRLALRKQTLRRVVPLSDRQLGAVAGGSRSVEGAGGPNPYGYDPPAYEPYGYGYYDGYYDDPRTFDPVRG